MKNRIMLVFVVTTLYVLVSVFFLTYAETCGDLTYSVSNGQVTITGCNTSAISVAIPEIIEGYPVTVIAEKAFYNCDVLKTLTIPESITTLEPCAVYNCDNLEFINWNAKNADIYPNGCLFLNIGNDVAGVNIIFGENVESIPASCFFSDGSNKIKSVTMGKNISYVGAGAFEGCVNIENVYLPGLESVETDYHNVTANPLYYAKKLYINGELVTELVISDEVETIGDYAFAGFEGLTDVVMGKNINAVGEGAFRDCTGLKNITISENVADVGECAFDECRNLIRIVWNAKNVSVYPDRYRHMFNNAGVDGAGITVIFGDKAEKIPDYCFYSEVGDTSNPYIKNIIIGENVTHIGKMSFFGCSGVTEVIIPDSVTTIGDNAFGYCSGLNNVIIGENVTEVGRSAFAECLNLKEITIPEGVENIGENAFANCSGITELNISEGITSISCGSFSGCSGITSLIIPNTVTSIGSGAFWGCSGITDLIIPDSILYIESEAFMKCVGLQTLTLGKNIVRMGYGAFRNCEVLEQINWNTIEFSESYTNDVFTNAGINGEGVNVIFGDSVKIIPKHCFHSTSSSASPINIKSVTIGENVTSIGKYAFYRCRKLTRIIWNAKNIPWFENNNYIFAEAGQDAGGIEVVFGDKAETIPAYCFYPHYSSELAPKIKSIDIGENVINIGTRAFYQCAGLGKIVIPENVGNIGSYAFSGCADLTEVVISENLTKIGNAVFYDCKSLTKVHIPKSVTQIAERAFGNCDSISYLYYNGTKSDWEKVVAGKANESLNAATIYFTPDEAKTKTEISEDGKNFTVKADDSATGKTIFLVLYNMNELVAIKKAEYSGENVVLNSEQTYDNIKIMLWESVKDMKPFCLPEEIKMGIK